MKSEDAFTGYNSKMKETARKLRKNMTKQEKNLWYDFLKLYPVKWYRQRSINSYIVDFYCSQAGLIIELDGYQHYTENGIEYDCIRTDILEKYNLEVIRFSNIQIDYYFNSVCNSINKTVQKRIQKLNKKLSSSASPFSGEIDINERAQVSPERSSDAPITQSVGRTDGNDSIKENGGGVKIK